MIFPIKRTEASTFSDKGKFEAEQTALAEDSADECSQLRQDVHEGER